MGDEGREVERFEPVIPESGPISSRSVALSHGTKSSPLLREGGLNAYGFLFDEGRTADGLVGLAGNREIGPVDR